MTKQAIDWLASSSVIQGPFSSQLGGIPRSEMLGRRDSPACFKHCGVLSERN